MISKKSVELYFTNNLGWKKLSHLPGDFSVTPSLCGNLLRVFSSNIKNRIDGLSVLGGFGFYSFNENFPFKEYLAISSHISNFHEYFHTPNMNNENDLSVFANKISQSLDSLPKHQKIYLFV